MTLPKYEIAFYVTSTKSMISATAIHHVPGKPVTLLPYLYSTSKLYFTTLTPDFISFASLHVAKLLFASHSKLGLIGQAFSSLS